MLGSVVWRNLDPAGALILDRGVSVLARGERI